MANDQNLIPNEARTPEERRENARKAGIASGAARRRKRDLKMICEQVSKFSAPPKTKRILKELCPDGEEIDIDMLTAAVFGQYRAASNGNAKSMQWITETMGVTIDDMEEEDDLSKALRELGESL